MHQPVATLLATSTRQRRTMRRRPQRETARYSREVWLLCIISALGSGAYLGVHQLLSSLFVLRLGYGADTVGTLSATGAMSFSAACLLGGFLGTRLGARRTLILGVITYALGMAMPPLASVIPIAARLGWLLAAQVVISLGWSTQVVSVITAMAAVTDVRNRRGAYALREAFSSGGMLLGALIGGLLPGALAAVLGTTTDLPGPYGLALWVSVAVGGATLIPILMVSADTAPQTEAPRTAAPQAAGSPAPSSAELAGPATESAPRRRGLLRLDRALLILIACGFATNAAHAACKTFEAVYLDRVFGVPTSVIGTITSLGMGATALAALSSGRVGRRRNSGQMMLLGASGMIAALLFMALVRHPIGAYVGVVGVYGVLGFWRPAYQSLQMEIARPEERPLVSAVSTMGMSLGFGTMGLLGGYIATGAGYPAVFLAGAGMAVISAALGGVLSRRGAESQRLKV
jgi:predicted MFS family arabinose efflux permease